MDGTYKSPKIISEVAELLRKPLPRAEEDIEIELISLVALQYPVVEMTADMGRLLYEKRKQLLWPKDKDLTEMDRQIRLNADVAPIERDYSLLIKIEELLKVRVGYLMRELTS